MTARNAFGNLALDATAVAVKASVDQLDGDVKSGLAPLALDATLSALSAKAAKDSSLAAILAALNGTIGDGGAQWITGTKTKFRDGFTTGSAAAPVDPAVWNLVNEAPDSGNGQGHLVLPGGDAAGASYLRVSLSPWAAGKAVHLSSVAKFQVPFRHAWGISASQRIVGQEVLFGLGEANDGDLQLGLNRLAQPADLTISGTVTVTSNVGTIVFAAPHGLRGNDRVILVGNTRRELNVGPVYITVVDALTITVTIVLANGTYPAGGVVRIAEPTALLNNAALQLWGDTTTTTNSTYATRRNGTKYRVLTSQGTVASTPIQNNTSPYSDAWLAAGPAEIWASIDEVVWRSYGDSTAGTSGYNKFTQSIPDESVNYRLYCRAKALDNVSRPIARIVSITKTGTTTATATTDVPHGLAVNDYVSVVGVRDQVNFPGAATVVVTVPTATTFTVVIGPAATATDALGGVVWIDHGNVLTPGNISQYVQSIQSVQAGVLQVIGNTTWSGIGPGDTINLYGMLGTAQPYEGAYKVLRLSGTTLEVVPLSGAVATFASITTGGQVIRRTDVRLHYTRILDYSRVLTEVVGGRGNTSDGNNSVPVAITSAATINANPMAVFSTTEPVTNAALGAGATYTQPAVQTNAAGTGSKPSRMRVIVGHAAGVLPGTLILQQSSDNATFRETWRAPIPSDAGYHTFEVPLHLAYYRFLFINGATAQTAFWLSTLASRGEGTNAVDVTQNLPFMHTPAAGQALAAAAVFTGPVLDLGVTHGWSLTRLLVSSDQLTAAAPTGVALQQSMDGTTWAPATTASTAITTANTSVALEDKIVGRYLRCIVTNGATAATALRVTQSLLTI